MPRTPSLTKTLLLAAIIALGVGTAWCSVAGWTIGMIAAALSSRGDYEQLLVSSAGEPLISHTSRDRGAAERVLTLTGQEVKVDRQDLLYPNYLQHPDQRVGWSKADWSYRLTSANDGGTPEIYWYLIHDGRPRGRAYGVGYHSKTKMIVGYFGREGFATTLPPADQWFEVTGADALVGATPVTNSYQPGYGRASDALIALLANDKLWVIDVAKHGIKPVLDCPAAQQIGSVWRLPKEPAKRDPDAYNQGAQLNTPTDAFIRQPDSVVVVDYRSGKHTTFPIPPDARHAMHAGFHLGDGNLLLFVWDLDEWKRGQDLLWLSPSGEVLRREHVELTGHYAEESEAAIGWAAAAVAPAPLASAVVTFGMPLLWSLRSDEHTYVKAFAKFATALWPSVLAVLVGGALCGTAAYRRQRRFGLPHATAWAIFVFIGGLPAWLAYRFHRQWPVLEECPTCHQPAPRNRASCLDCGNSFPPPAQKGIEVFA